MRINSFLFLLLSFYLIFAPSHARGLHIWTMEELTQGADLVAIIEPMSTKDIGETSSIGDIPSRFICRELETTFNVDVVLKGRVDDKKIVLLHCGLSPRDQNPTNGPTFITFLTGPLDYEGKILKNNVQVGGFNSSQITPCWLAFLTHLPDGRYAPVAGQMDAVLSFKELHAPPWTRN